VKQSGDDFGDHVPLVKLARSKNFVVLTGADARLKEALDLGVCGSITGMANAVPDLMVPIFSAFQAGEPKEPGVAAERMKILGTLLDKIWFPLNISALMRARDLPVGEPKEVISPETDQRCGKLIEELRSLFKEWKLG
jgi:dihydrodipicolinate synthase/N-acetylneuraminate lyase